MFYTKCGLALRLTEMVIMVIIYQTLAGETADVTQ